jgi:multidrug resistance efflux pump
LSGTYGTYYKPNRPTNVYPSSGGIVIAATNFVTSAYSHSQGTPQLATKWEIRTGSGTYEDPVLAVTTTNSYLTNYPIPFDQITYGQSYYWRATHIDTNGHPSVVSAEMAFSWGTTNASAGALVLNEILAENRDTVQNGGKYPDYIELKNNSATNIPLAGYTLTDDPLKPAKFTFASDATIAAGGYLLIWCDSDTSAPSLHTGFGLDSAGDSALLLNSGVIVDSVAFGPQAPDVSIGRIANGTGGWQANTLTPLTANSAKTLGSVSNLRVNEWMADPAYGDDWFELYNTDTNVVALAGLYLSDTPSTPMIMQIPALSFIEGKGFAKFFADGSTAGGNHCNFKLAKGGESIVLTAANGATTLDTITFSSQTTDVSQGRLPDGGSTIVSFSSKTASPGHPNWAPTNGVFINELLANAAAPLEDAIEIYNTNTSAVDIGGWWLSDDLIVRQKFQIPAGTTVPAGGYKTFYAADFAGGTVPFGFNAKGDEVMLSAVDSAGNLTGYGSLVRFGAAAENKSFGRVAATGLNASSGNSEFWPLTAHTFGQDNPADAATFRTGTGAANALPKIGPVTINEIMYHPTDLTGGIDDTNNEFIELFNLTTNAVSLGGWRLRGDTEFIVPSGQSIAAGGYLLLVSFDPTNTAALASFRTNYSLSTNVVIYGPYSEKLANSTFDVEIAYPALIDGYTNYVNMDKVEYRDTTLVGQAEAPLAVVSSQKPGVLAGLSVSRFQTVKAGDIVGHLIVADPKMVESSLAVIRAELDMLRANMSPIATQQRNAMNYAQLRLDWMKERAALASVKVNFQLAEAEWHRSEELFKDKLISQSQLDIAKANYGALQQQVEELTRLVADGEKSFASMQPVGTADISEISNEPMRAAMAVQEAKLRLTEAELNPITLTAPINGVVTLIYLASGEAVMAGQPIISIAAIEPTRIVGYLRPPLSSEPAAGDRVEVRTRGRHRVTASAQIIAIGAQLETVPAVFGGLARLDLAQQGLPVNISLPANLKIHPGELVDITLLPQTD